MNFVGKIDREMFQAAVLGTLTDEVILTDPQRQHIIESHPNDYERYARYLPVVLLEPDFIVEDNNPNSAVLLKKIDREGKRFQLILRLKVEDDPIDYKNSVITFWKIEEKRYRRYLRTKKVLYKRV